MNWTTPKSGQCYIESIPARFTVAKVHCGGKARYSLVDGKDKLVGWFSTADEAKRQADVMRGAQV